MTTEPLRTSPAVRASITSDGLVLLDVNGGVILASNAVGARIWQRLEQRCPPAEIARELASDFEQPIERTERDVNAFLSALAARGVVTGGTRC